MYEWLVLQVGNVIHQVNNMTKNNRLTQQFIINDTKFHLAWIVL